MKKKDKMTFVLTSCGRIDLLDKTLSSFFKFNRFKMDNHYLVEDSVDDDVYKHVKKKWGSKLELLLNKKKKVKLLQ